MSDTKRAAIFHGTGNSPADCWLPWIKHLLEQSGYEVFAPLLPGNDTPNKDTYESFLRRSAWDFAGNVLVGHSSGATTILNLLSTDWFPHVSAAVLAGTFLNERLTESASWYVPGQFDNLFLPEYDPTVIKQKADTFYFVHGSNDPFCDIDDAKQFCNKVGGTFMTVPNGHHLGSGSGLTELPELASILRNDGILA